MFDDSAILITGGTGSFGQAFTSTLLERYSPRRIIIYSRDEQKQYEMQQRYAQSCMRYFIGDVRDAARLQQAMNGVDFVIHAAALKQVEAAEYNPFECIKTNIEGAENVVHASLAAGVQKVIALSTDKAANPISLYGATKLASDKLFVAANNIVGNNDTRFSCVRYGNVVGSRGSVIPHFKQLLADGSQQLPITHREMTRFWITLQQGVDFVLNNFARMHGGEIFVPKIPSIRIVDLAEAIAPGVATTIIGIRPGEKMHEIMCPLDESHLTVEFDDHFLISPAIRFYDRDTDFLTNRQGQQGRRVETGFEYHSGNNPDFLSLDTIVEFVRQSAA